MGIKRINFRMHKLKRVRQLEYVHKQNNESYIIYVGKVSSLIKKTEMEA